MKWHLVCRIGEDDTFTPTIETAEPRLLLHFSGGADDERVREHVVAGIEENYDTTLGGAVVDFVYASMAAYLADLCIPRSAAADRWSRELVLYLPVYSLARRRSASKEFTESLEFLTGDKWTLSLRGRGEEAPTRSCAEGSDLPDTVCLLSGGLDSLIGAIDLLASGRPIAFVSHHGGGLTPKFQNETLDALGRRFSDQVDENIFYIVPPKLDDDGENTMRSRSILFIALGIAVASALGDDVPLVVPENGLISLNAPLTGSRVGSSSTRTTHPHFIEGVRLTLRELGITNPIELPYRHKTKGEMLSGVADRDALKALLAQTMSCSHSEASRWAGATPGTHCGYCLPCLIRRAAVLAAGLSDADADYVEDVTASGLALGGQRGRDLRAVKMALMRDQARPSSDALFHVLESGPLPPAEVEDYAAIYLRGMAELRALLDGSDTS